MVKTFLLVLSLAAGILTNLIDEDDNEPSCPELHDLQLQNHEMAGVLLGICVDNVSNKRQTRSTIIFIIIYKHEVQRAVKH